MQELSLTIHNPTGLHARPAKVLAKLAKKYGSDISIKHGQNEANAKSMISILKLGVKSASEIQLIISGEDEMEASVALEEAFRTGLGEDVHPPAPKTVKEATTANGNSSNGHANHVNEEPALSKHILKGLAASPGLAIGPIFRLKESSVSVSKEFLGIDAETESLHSAIDVAVNELKALREKLLANGIQDEADIFEAHLEIISDPELINGVVAGIQPGQNASQAWQTVIATESGKMAALDDETLAARAADIRDVGDRILRILSKSTQPAADDHIPQRGTPYILMAEDLAPSHTASLDANQVAGILTEKGGPTAHSAILARALGIPAVVGMGESIKHLADEQLIILDGSKGAINIQPGLEDLEKARTEIEANAKFMQSATLHAHQPAMTIDGHLVEIGGNGGSIADSEAAFEAGADGIGLLRTEFLFLKREAAPSEEDQFKIYQGITSAMQGKSVIFRTLDIGGDKPVPYITVPHEENPFLGERGIRLQINRPEILRTQLRAILRTAKGAPLRIMFPMVGQLSEWREVKKIVEEVRQEVGAPAVEVGIMIEIPSAAIMATAFAAEVDFFSVGTNDLTQYTLAIDRQHPTLTAKADGLDPAVLKLIKMTVDGARAHGKWVGVCGELGSDPQAVPILIGLGVDELSVNVKAIARVKAQVRQLSLTKCQALAYQALHCTTAADVRKL